jgi:transcriptional regulator with XRE-family HTH domain
MSLNTKEDILKQLETAIGKIDQEQDIDHEAKMIMYRFLSEVERVSEDMHLNRKEIAARIGTSASYITQLFRGNKLINMHTIAKFQELLNIKFEIKAIPNNIADSFNEVNLESLCKNQNAIEGFWAFHKFKPQYDNSRREVNLKVKKSNDSRIA